MDRSNITVTMPIYEYEQLESKADGFDYLIRMLERANQDGKAVMTNELRTIIFQIYVLDAEGKLNIREDKDYVDRNISEGSRAEF